MLSDRAGEVHDILVDEYVNSAFPVPSDDIARRSPHKVSSATIRSTMSQLTEEGYISRPHVSAGAVPLNRAYRHYVESLKSPLELPPGLRQQINRQFEESEPDVELWSRRCATILSRISTNMAIVTVPWARSPRLKQIQLVYLEDYLALLVVVLQEARLLRRVLSLQEPTNQAHLNQAANMFNDRLSDMDYRQVEATQLELSPLEARVKIETMTMLRDVETAKSPEHYIDGLRWLLNQPEFSRDGSARGLVELVEDDMLLGSILAQKPEAEDVAVYIGEENPDETLRSFGMIVCQYGVSQQATGTICVIGPTRMGYAQAIGGVSFLSSLMDQLVGELYGGDPSHHTNS